MVGSCCDHFLLNFTVNISLALHRPVGCYKKNSPYHSKIDYEGLTNYFLDYDFSSFYEIDDIELLWSSLKQTIHCSIQLFASPQAKDFKGPIWFNSEIRHNLHQLRSKDLTRLSLVKKLLQPSYLCKN